ncbi:MAG: phosphodiester glycosidase family protein [Bacteroidota bacterium]
MKLHQMLTQLRKEQINTWFDLGLFIDKTRESRRTQTYLNKEVNLQRGALSSPTGGVGKSKGSFKAFKRKISKGGISFITFHYSIDGVTIEIQKYAKALRNIMPGVPIHYLAGDILPVAEQFIDSSCHKQVIKEINGFDSWELYPDFFFTKMERGSKEYNELIIKFWKDVLNIIDKLGTYIEKNNIRLLWVINACSNPGNVSLSFALALLSEYLRIPVINNNHDFYWEGGNKKIDIKTKGLKPGPRDFFFLNSHIGEFFSLIEVLFPWESPSWINVNINNSQSRHLIETNGHNPANVSEICTSIDTSEYTILDKRVKVKAFMQVQAMLSNYKKNLPVHKTEAVIKAAPASPDPMLLGAKKSSSFDFVNNNIVFLQPTRLMPRKRIEINFKLIRKLFENDNFTAKFVSNPNLKLTLLITGPIPMGQYEYFLKLLRYFSDSLEKIPPVFRNRVFLAFLFSEFDKERFTKRVEQPVNIPELYNMSSLIMLPSQTEGRGLPIIESTSCGVPIFCRRYDPEKVYSEVIGEHLEEKDRLKVLEFSGSHISKELAEKIIDRVFFPQNFIDEIEHNRRAVQKRYSLETLTDNTEEILNKLYLQLKPDEESEKLTTRLMKQYKKSISPGDKDTGYLINDKNRHFLPGYGRLAFMALLKSLIDPSFFRVEEQLIRGMTMRFAKKLIDEDPGSKNLDTEKLHHFYNTVDNIFYHHKGDFKTRHDHSFAYRHRNEKYYPYHDFTFQELAGLVNMIYNKIASPAGNKEFERIPHFFTNWDLAMFQLTNSSNLAIDDRERLADKLRANVPVSYFPGEYIKYELEFFVVHPVRTRLKLKIDEELTEKHLKKHHKSIAPVFIFCQEKPLGKWFTAKALDNYIANTNNNELKLIYKYGICKVVTTKQWCVGVHFTQLGKYALKVLGRVKKEKGFIITNGDNAPVMTDIIDIDRFHIGRVDEGKEETSRIMGIPAGDGFIQFVPAGIRTTLAYPTPVQTAKDFSDALNSNLFKKLSKKLGEEKIFELLKKDAETKGTPIKTFLPDLESEIENKKKKSDVTYSFVSGAYKDKLPWSGAIANVDISGSSKKWNFATFTPSEKSTDKHGLGGNTMPVTEFIKEFNSNFNKKAQIGWNGGYILNPELVGKLGLPESYIGSPLGLLISDGEVISPPLFNKPALIIYSNGILDIRRVNCMNGLTITDGKHIIDFDKQNYNKPHVSLSVGIQSGLSPLLREEASGDVSPLLREEASGDVSPLLRGGAGGGVAYYDLMYDEENILGNGNIIIRLAGNTIKEVIHTKKDEEVKIIPVGLTLSIPASQFPKEWYKVEKKLTILMKPGNNGSGKPAGKDIINWEQIAHAVEAGPMLLNNGKNCIDMKEEGWKTRNSINTQAARLDFTDMRGPKIAVGLDKAGNLSVLTINGRIRESVGATHHDMGEIMKEFGIQKAMGFDPGGSSTLVVDGKTLNISPYNSHYEKDIYSLPPEPRAVANAVIGWQE